MAGVAKLYNGLGENTDGAVTQAAAKTANDAKVDKSGDTMSGGLDMGGHGIGSVGVLADVSAIVAKNSSLLIKGRIELDADHGSPLYNIKNVKSPVDSTDAANKGYVDTHIPAASPYTFVVDSDAKLAAWANNTAGNDYTSVLIKPGTWTNAIGVNIENTGTKYVKGAPGGKLVITGDSYGIWRENRPNTQWELDEILIEGVSIEGSTCFFNLNNLVNCTAHASGHNNEIGFIYVVIWMTALHS